VSAELHRIAGAAWALRERVEHEAARRFTRLAAAIAGFDPASPVIAMLLRAAADEERHAGLCAELRVAYGHAAEPTQEERSIVPPVLSARQGVLYEMVAACCITETESVATLATLLSGQAEPHIHVILHALARDEVVHSRMGWAHLSREAASRLDLAFLSRWIPAMLAGTVEEGLFVEAPPEADVAELPRHGLLPRARRREVFTRTLLEVVLPGLARFGIDPGAARSWLAAREAPGGAS
jgi:Rubrerythrin